MRATKRSRSTTTRSIVPAPTTRSSAGFQTRAMKLNTSCDPATSVSSASTTSSSVSGLARLCSRLAEVPTDVDAGSRYGAIAAMAAASASASSRGVARTGTSPLPIAAAVSSSVTTARTVARSPTASTGSVAGLIR